MYIAWQNIFSVNIKEIDEQHKKLIDIINELYDSMKIGKGKEILENTLDKMIKYAQTHFTKEEEYMTDYKYPEYKAHKGEHKKFVKKVLTFQKDFKGDKLALSSDVMEFLRNWLINHIMETDKKYAPFFNEKGLK